MGAEQSSTNDIEIGEELPKTSNIYKIWTSAAPARFQKEQDVTVLVKQFNENDTEETRKFYENGVKNLKLLRHPHILRYFSVLNTKYETYLIVERVKPLDLCLNEDLIFETDEILCGLQNIFDAVKFLHENACLSHNNLGPLAIFVCSDQTWKLGSFELSLSGESGAHWSQSDFVKSVKEIEFVPPEDQKVMAVKAPSHARDVYSLGKLVEFVLPYLIDKIQSDQLREINDFVELLCTLDSTKRPKLTAVDYSRIFRNELSDISSKLRNIPLMAAEEKEELFKCNMSSRLRRLPPSLVARKLTKLLLCRYVFVEKAAFSNFLINFLTPKSTDDENCDENDDGILPTALFKQFVIPELQKMFRVHEKLIRLNLLSVFDRYYQMFDRKRLQDFILPELLLSMKDVDESLVASSMQCLALLVSILGCFEVTGNVHAKYFSDGRPRDRLNHSSPAAENFSRPKLKVPLASSFFCDSPTDETKKTIENSKLEREKIVERRAKNSTNSSEEVPITPERRISNSSDWTDWDNEAPPDEIPTTAVVNESPVKKFDEFQTLTTPKNVSKPLGSEFDVMSVEISREESEIDNIFDEMTPVVRKPLISAVKTPSKFDVAVAEEPTAGSGWFEQDDED